METSSYITTYQQYLRDRCSTVDDALLTHVAEIIQQTQWDEPQSSLDFNNIGVMALLEAEANEAVEARELFLDMAIAAFNEGATHPLCAAHLALIQSLLGDRNDAIQAAFSTFIAVLVPAYANTNAPPGLIFLPQRWQGYSALPYTQLVLLLELENSYQQSVLLTGEVLCQSQFVFYNPSGLRFLQLATRLFPASTLLNLTLGISSIMGAQWEGLLYLHSAQQQLPAAPSILQALTLAYQNLGQWETADYWRQQAIEDSSPTDTHWTSLPLDSSLTYVPLENRMLIAVEASFQSIVTGVLLSKGTWFEAEMEFWRDYLKPGMTVVDVGANVGVYTFSAALEVGETGRVIAIEPFSNCVQCLQETCRVNQLTEVTVCPGAASDRDGTAYLSLHAASELNELVDQPTTTANQLEEVPCFRLDTLMEQGDWQRVDVLKIDAEGHELQVLNGSDRLLSQFAPVIMYENIAGNQRSNLPVAKHLLNKGYQLFRYQPFVKQLHPIQLTDNLDSSLNIIALPVGKT